MYIHLVVFHSIQWILWNLSTWQVSISINVPRIVDKFFQHYIPWYICDRGHVDIFQWNRKWFFSRHVQFDSGSYVMTVKKVPWNRPEIISCFTIRQWWVLKSGLKKTRLILQEGLLGLLLGLGDPGLRWMFSEPDLLQRVWLFHLRLRIQSFSMDFRCVHLFHFLNVCDQNVSFPDSSGV